MTFKKVQVVMLSTKEKAELVLSKDGLFTTKNTRDWDKGNTETYQHLYILSDEEIKEGDWFIDMRDKIEDLYHEDIYCAGRGGSPEFATKIGKKIIATTDSFLQIHDKTPIGENINGLWKPLPQPSLQFLEVFVREYNKGNVITSAMVEYDFDDKSHSENPGWHNHKLKTNCKDNTITIKRVKDSWNREEVESLIKKVIDDTRLSRFGGTTDWFEQNL